METFFRSNPGLSSRIAHHIDFPDYAPEELMAVAKLMLEKQNYRFDAQAEDMFAQYIARRMQMQHFANARSIRNALERARLRQAQRLFARGGAVSREALMTVEADDIRASRVFGETRTPRSPAAHDPLVRGSAKAGA
jgi:hypothetical protein